MNETIKPKRRQKNNTGAAKRKAGTGSTKTLAKKTLFPLLPAPAIPSGILSEITESDRDISMPSASFPIVGIGASAGGLEALEIISKNSGTLYDPGVADACVRLFQEKEHKMVE